jgi:hypothetical protein
VGGILALAPQLAVRIAERVVVAVTWRVDERAPHPFPLPTARKSSREEGSGEAVLT